MAGGGGYAVFQRAGLIDGAGKHGIAHAFFHRQAFAGNRRLVYCGAAAHDFAVQPDAFARLHPHHAAHGHIGCRDFLPTAIGLLHGGGVGCQRHQPGNGVAGAVERAGFNQFGQRKQHHHHRRFRPMANHNGAGNGNAHQRIDIQAAAFYRHPALFIGAQAAQSHRHQRQRGAEPRRIAQPVGTFRQQRRHPGHNQRPQRLFVFCRQRQFAAAIGQFRLEAERTQRRQYLLEAFRRVHHREHPLHQVEFEAFYLRHVAQFFAD